MNQEPMVHAARSVGAARCAYGCCGLVRKPRRTANDKRAERAFKRGRKNRLRRELSTPCE